MTKAQKSTQARALSDADLDRVSGGGKNEGSIVFANHPDTPWDAFYRGFIKGLHEKL